MASPFDRLMKTATPHLPGAIEPAIKLELFGVCTEFLERSLAWQDEVNVVFTYGDQEASAIFLAGRMQLLIGLKDNKGQNVYGATNPESNVIRLPQVLAGSSVGGGALPLIVYKAAVAINVTDPIDATSFPIMPTDLVVKYTPVLMHGLLAAMMAQPSKPYTNLQMANYYRTRFTSGCARAKNNISNGNTFASQRWMFPQTFANRK